MKISIVVGASENNAIGRDNSLPWHHKGDLENFKNITSGKTLIMGRKCFESIGFVLPNRRSIVLSRNSSLDISGAETADTIPKALNLVHNVEEVMVIGGAEIYERFLPLASEIHFTRIHAYIDDADAYFPQLDYSIWECKEIKALDSLATYYHLIRK